MLEILDLKVVVAVSSIIYKVAAVYGAPVSRISSPSVYMVNAKELRVPDKGGLVSPK
jgi:hypothetical protein